MQENKFIISPQNILSDFSILTPPINMYTFNWFSIDHFKNGLRYPQFIKLFSNNIQPLSQILDKFNSFDIKSTEISKKELFKIRIIKIFRDKKCIDELLKTEEKEIFMKAKEGVLERCLDLEKIRECIIKLELKDSVIDFQKDLEDSKFNNYIEKYNFISNQNFDIKIPNNYEDYAKSLLENGYTIIPLLDTKELWFYNQYLKHELINFPEYKTPTIDTIFVYGGFGALGNPSSFHNYLVRSLRLRVMPLVVPLFKLLNQKEGKENRKLEQIIDRMAIRRFGTTVTAESWHRDQAPLPDKQDDVFGGWINLDLTGEQYFSCVPKTHKQNRDQAGFVRLTEEEVKNAEKNKKKLVIPPGHIFIFYQDLMHEVLKRKMPYTSYRLFTGFRLTTKKEPLFDSSNKKIFGNSLFKQGYDIKSFDYKEILENQGPVPLPSGQHPPMYAKNNIMYKLQRKNLLEWSKNTFKQVCTETKTYGGEEINIVDRFMKSLWDYNLPLYKSYSQEEISILTPNKEWNLNLYDKQINLKL